MALQSIININVDFYDKKHILINAKQLDNNSRVLSITCYSHGIIQPLNSSEHSAYIRYRKPDNLSVFNFCEINDKGKVLVKLTEQMLASGGICCAELVIVNKGDASVNSNTGEIITINEAAILSTMTFYIDVSEIVVENADIESSYEFSGLNEALNRAEAEYENIVKTAKSWAVGGTGARNDEAENNAKYWAQVAAQNAVGLPSVVTSIKGSNESSYRNGQVIITANNVGAIPSADIATVNEVKSYLGI